MLERHVKLQSICQILIYDQSYCSPLVHIALISVCVELKLFSLQTAAHGANFSTEYKFFVGDRNCAVFNRETGSWRDVTCDLGRSFLCERGKNNFVDNFVLQFV